MMYRHFFVIATVLITMSLIMAGKVTAQESTPELTATQFLKVKSAGDLEAYKKMSISKTEKGKALLAMVELEVANAQARGAFAKACDAKFGAGSCDLNIPRARSLGFYEKPAKFQALEDKDSAMVLGANKTQILMLSKQDGKWYWDADQQYEKTNAAWIFCLLQRRVKKSCVCTLKC